MYYSCIQAGRKPYTGGVMSILFSFMAWLDAQIDNGTLRELTWPSGLTPMTDRLGECKTLTRLILRGCEGLTSLPKELVNCTALIELDLAGCNGLISMPDLSGLARLQVEGLPGHLQPWEAGGRKAWPEKDHGGPKPSVYSRDAAGALTPVRGMRVLSKEEKAAEEERCRLEAQRRAQEEAAEEQRRQLEEQRRAEEIAALKQSISDSRRNRAEEIAASKQSIKQRRAKQNGQTGYITITLSWDTPCDLDLHCTTPDGGNISFSHKVHGGGELDIDANASQGMDQPIENIFFATRPEPGPYTVKVHNYESRIAEGDTAFTLLVEIGEASHRFQSTLANKKEMHVATVQVPTSTKEAPTVIENIDPDIK